METQQLHKSQKSQSPEIPSTVLSGSTPALITPTSWGGPEVLEKYHSTLDFGSEAPACPLKEVSDICRRGDKNGPAHNLHRLIQEKGFYKKKN